MMTALVFLAGYSNLTCTFQVENWKIKTPNHSVVSFTNEFGLSVHWGKGSQDRLAAIVTAREEQKTVKMSKLMDYYIQKLSRFSCVAKKKYLGRSGESFSKLTFRTNLSSGSPYLSLFIYRSNSILEIYMPHQQVNLSSLQSEIATSIRRTRLREL